MSGLEKLKAKFDFIAEVRGSGLLLACLKEGLLVNRVKPNALRFMPPLIVTRGEVDEALDILETVLARRLTNDR